MGPKNESEKVNGVRYHAKNRVIDGKMKWIFEEETVTMTPINMILVRVLIGKLSDPNGLAEILRTVRVVEDDATWNCVSWVKDALTAVATNRTAVMGNSILDWKSVRAAVMAYCQRKKDQHRFDGLGNFDTAKIPTFDLLERRETVP